MSAPILLFAQVRLEVVPLKHGDYFIGEAASINNKGQVLGEIDTATVIWQRDAETRLIYSPEILSPQSINDSGTIVGYRGHKTHPHDELPSYYDAYVWNDKTGYQYIPTAQLHESGALPTVRPWDLSNTGFAVGTSSILDSTGSYRTVTKGWIWPIQNGLTEIPRLAEGFGFEETQPSAVNDHGVVVGTYGFDFSADGGLRIGGFVYDAVNGTRALGESILRSSANIIFRPKTSTTETDSSATSAATEQCTGLHII